MSEKWEITQGSGGWVNIVSSTDDPDVGRSVMSALPNDAKIIVTAVNNHEALVKQARLSALESCREETLTRGRLLSCPELEIPAIIQCISCKARALLADIDKDES